MTATEVDRRAAEALCMTIRRDEPMPTMIAVEYVMESGVERPVAIGHLRKAAAKYLERIKPPTRTFGVYDIGYRTDGLISGVLLGDVGECFSSLERIQRPLNEFGADKRPTYRWWVNFANVAKRVVSLVRELKELL